MPKKFAFFFTGEIKHKMPIPFEEPADAVGTDEEVVQSI